MTQPNREPKSAESDLCSDCPPVGYPTDETRCNPCPRRSPETEHVEPEGEVDALVAEALDPNIRVRMVAQAKRCSAIAGDTYHAFRDKITARPDCEEAAKVRWYAQERDDIYAMLAEIDRLASALSSRRALSREEVARIIDPDAWGPLPEGCTWVPGEPAERQSAAFAKADAILSRVAPPSKVVE